MELSRRSLLGSTLASSLTLPSGLAAQSTPRTPRSPRDDFALHGIYLDCASSHPIGASVRDALQRYNDRRINDPRYVWRLDSARDDVATLFARLINAAPEDIAIVPSTMIGENLISASLGIGPGDRVVTDDFHYFASLMKYGEMRKQGVDVVMVPPRGNRITLEDIEAVITPKTRLVAVSLVASRTGFMHDLHRLCDIAHRRGALVYADLIQAAGAVPIDVKESGVDFACCGGHKWLQGDHGAALLYVRPGSFGHLRRVQVGWQQMKSFDYHALPTDPPGPAEGSWTFAPDSPRSYFEVSTLSHQPLWALRASIAYILSIGVDRIADHRRPFMARLYDGMQSLGYEPVTPREQNSPIASFTRAGLRTDLKKRFLSKGIAVGVGDGVIRVGPSVFTDMTDIEALLAAARD